MLVIIFLTLLIKRLWRISSNCNFIIKFSINLDLDIIDESDQRSRYEKFAIQKFEKMKNHTI